MPDLVSAAVVQLSRCADKARNLESALGLVDDAIARYRHLDIVALPELFYEDPAPEDAAAVGEPPEEFIEAFASRAKSAHCYVVAGSIARRGGSQLFNTSLLFDRSGEIVGSYDKIHVCDAFGVGESATTTCGSKPLVFEADFGILGIVICYDLRFPELPRTLALAGAEYLIAPSAFYTARQEHWVALVHAAALQNYMYVIAPNMIGSDGAGDPLCGRSMIVDPWGVTLSTAPDRPCHTHAYLDADFVKEVRERAGRFTDRVPAAYDLS